MGPLKEVNEIHETKPEKIYETKQNFAFDEMKQNEILLFLLFCKSIEISRNNFFVSLFNPSLEGNLTIQNFFRHQRKCLLFVTKFCEIQNFLTFCIAKFSFKS
jgi:hypothetical protein